MGERRFYLREQINEAEIDYQYTITESELKRRIMMLTGGDYREGDIDIIINGEPEQDDKPSSSPTRAEWEEWAGKVAAEFWPVDIFSGRDGDHKRETAKAALISMPIVPKE